MSRPRTRIVFRKADPRGQGYLPHWHYDWTIEGRRFRGSTGEAQKSSAEKIALAKRQALVDHLRAGGPAPTPDSPTLNEATGRYEDEYAKHLASYKDTVAPHIDHLLRELGPNIRLVEITDAVVADMISKLRGRSLAELRPETETIAKDSPLRKRRLSPATVNRVLNTLGALLRRCRDVWKLPASEPKINGLRPAEPDGREIFIGPDQAAAVDVELALHARPIATAALLTGLRKANVLQLDWQKHVDLRNDRITVRVKSRKPEGKVHSVGIVPALRALLEQLAPDPAQRKGPVFKFGQNDCACNWCKRHAGEPIKGIKRTFRRARTKAGVEGLRFHDLRHSVASAIINQGGDLKLVKEILGHEDLQTTERYAHLMEARKAKAMAKALTGFAGNPRVARRRRSA